ncbi:protein kinase, putative [Cordyceps militaris CM01]|uniref:Protein kinase, putative n=1 Tax=Cordyceps militaris (strain CM01) TaxID=983644 RepID=G3JB09_CORMM|nr:protein kinase, putative [Cordyceps militaris CM01]EGX95221.1 protein kinase, putative [Cordyceps militaris CM01]
MPSKLHQDSPKWRSVILCGDEDYLESVRSYRSGGHHPVHINDRLDGARYRVLHKFGYGGSSTVWLCQDNIYRTPTYVAIKILIALRNEANCRELHMAQHLRALGVDKQPGAHLLCFPLRDFRQTGPNGTHICIVYPVLGPPLDLARETFEDHFNQDDCARIVRGLVYEIVGKPETVKVVVKDLSGEHVLCPDIPQYLVHSIDFIEPHHLSGQISITDFGESFNHCTEGERLTGIPRAYCAPELVFDKKGGLAADLWALGCLAFEARTGKKMIWPADLLGPNDREYLMHVILLLGRLPDKWWDTVENRDAIIVRSDGGTHSRLELRMEKWGNPEEERSIDAKIRASCYRNTQLDRNIKILDISEAEVEVMSKLLEQLLQYEPEKRLAAQDAVNHEWFRM